MACTAAGSSLAGRQGSFTVPLFHRRPGRHGAVAGQWARLLCMSELGVGLTLIVFTVGAYFSYEENRPVTHNLRALSAGCGDTDSLTSSLSIATLRVPKTSSRNLR